MHLAGQRCQLFLVARIVADAARQFELKTHRTASAAARRPGPATAPWLSLSAARSAASGAGRARKLQQHVEFFAAAARRLRPALPAAPRPARAASCRRRHALRVEPGQRVGMVGIGSANLRQRDRIVGSSRSRLLDDSRNTVPGGGSSSVLSKRVRGRRIQRLGRIQHHHAQALAVGRDIHEIGQRRGSARS